MANYYNEDYSDDLITITGIDDAFLRDFVKRMVLYNICMHVIIIIVRSLNMQVHHMVLAESKGFNEQFSLVTKVKNDYAFVMNSFSFVITIVWYAFY